MGGQTIAAWLKDKIAIIAVSDVKSTESILKYMKNTIPKLVFDPKSWKKFFEDVEEASTYRDKARDDEKKKKRHFAFGGKKKSRHGESGYGKGEEMDREFAEAFKEEIELEERKMTDAEMAEREEIVKKLKPKLQSFKDRYGDDAKKVMYATATKQAMEEVEINEVKFEAGKVYHQYFGGG